MSAEFIYLFMREFRLYVFHSTVTEGPTDYLKDKQKDEMNFFFYHIYSLNFFTEQMCVYVCVCNVNNIVNSPESTSISMYVNTERLLMVTGFVTLLSAV